MSQCVDNFLLHSPIQSHTTHDLNNLVYLIIYHVQCIGKAVMFLKKTTSYILRFESQQKVVYIQYCELAAHIQAYTHTHLACPPFHFPMQVRTTWSVTNRIVVSYEMKCLAISIGFGCSASLMVDYQMYCKKLYITSDKSSSIVAYFRIYWNLNDSPNKNNLNIQMLEVFLIFS